MCTNLEYIAKQLGSNELIYIDTCSLMDSERLLRFIENAKPVFLKKKMKIIVHHSVMDEIFKFEYYYSGHENEQAHTAREIIMKNLDLFQIQSNDDKADDNSECFADKELLRVLFENRSNHTQLLISNDRALTADAYNFNNVESVKGNRINVCYLDSHGQMNMCDCVKQRTTTTNTSKENNTTEEKAVSEEKTQEEPNVQFTANKAPAQPTEIPANSGSSAFTKYIFPGIAFIAGGFAREYAVPVIRKFIKSEWGIRL